jgi:hypothetical protein
VHDTLITRLKPSSEPAHAAARARVHITLSDIMRMLLDRFPASVPDVLACAVCQTHIANEAATESTSFWGRSGRAMLLGEAGMLFTNVTQGAPEERSLMTGRHACADVRCAGCEGYLGWRYVEAAEVSGPPLPPLGVRLCSCLPRLTRAREVTSDGP